VVSLCDFVCFSCLSPSCLFLMHSRPPISSLFPYTTLFRSQQLTNPLDEVRRDVAGLRARGKSQRIRFRETGVGVADGALATPVSDWKSTRLNSSHDQISYADFCLIKKMIMTSVSSQFIC